MFKIISIIVWNLHIGSYKYIYFLIPNKSCHYLVEFWISYLQLIVVSIYCAYYYSLIVNSLYITDIIKYELQWLRRKVHPCKGEINFFWSWNPLPCTQNFKPKFEFQTSLAQNSPLGTLEFLPFGANLDLPWDWKLPNIPGRDSSLFSPVGVYYTSPFLGYYTNHQKYKISYVPLNPVTDNVCIADIILELCVGWKFLPK